MAPLIGALPGALGWLDACDQPSSPRRLLKRWDFFDGTIDPRDLVASEAPRNLLLRIGQYFFSRISFPDHEIRNDRLPPFPAGFAEHRTLSTPGISTITASIS
jgi:hypothetical protein